MEEPNIVSISEHNERIYNIEEKRPGTILHGALPACHSDARQNLRVAKQLGKARNYQNRME